MRGGASYWYFGVPQSFSVILGQAGWKTQYSDMWNCEPAEHAQQGWEQGNVVPWFELGSQHKTDKGIIFQLNKFWYFYQEIKMLLNLTYAIIGIHFKHPVS